MKKIYLQLLIIALHLIAANKIMAQCTTASTLLVDLKMESSFADSSLYNQSIFSYGSPTFGNDRHGNPSSALNSSAGTIFLNDAINGNFKCDFPITISVWILANGLGTYNPIFMNEDHGSAYSGVWINLLQSGEVLASIGNGGPAGIASRVTAQSPQGTIVPGNWYNITAVFNSVSDIKIYVNGILQTVTYSGNATSLYYYKITGTAGKIGSGVNGSGSNHYFDGFVDDVRLWNATLLPVQIQALYDEYRNFLPTSSLVLCEGESATAHTSSEFCAFKWSNGGTTATDTIVANDLGVGDHVIYAYAYDNHNVRYMDSVLVSVSVCVGLDENKGISETTVYPNPTNGLFTINANKPAQYALYNVLGEVMMTFQAMGTEELNIEAFPLGVYFLTEMETGKAIKLIKN